MSNHKLFIIIPIAIIILMLPGLTYAQKKCTAPELSADQIHELVVKERKTRDDVPPAFPKYKYNGRKEGCFYIYIEYGLPLVFDYGQTFRLNQSGMVVEATIGNYAESVRLKCSEKVYIESELAEIVKKERGKRQDLSPPFLNYKAYVKKSGCLYNYFELNLPINMKEYREYQLFTIGPFGELLEYSRSESN